VSDSASLERGSDPDRWQRWSLWAGTAALSASAIGASFSPYPLFRAYLAAYLFYLGIALGSLVLLMVYHLTGGSWGLLVRRILEAGMRTLPLLALLFLPIAAGIRYLYPWAQPGVVAASPQLQYQQFYLAPTYFWIRAAVYFAVWIAMAFLLASWSRQEDETGNPRLAWKSQQLGAFGAVVYGISIHFAAIDWGMSLQPVFHSTIWGPLFATGQLLSALACALVVLAWQVNRPPLAEVDSPKARNDLASLLLTLLIVWAYMAWFQFMLIWIANLPVDVVWYLPRATAPWQWAIWTIVIFHFAVPFFLLLVRSVKRNSKAVAWIAGLILLMHLAFIDYQVLPDFPAGDLSRPGTMYPWSAALFVPVGIGGIWLAHFLWQLQRYPLVALHDYNRAAALRLRRLDAEEAAREQALRLRDQAEAAQGRRVGFSPPVGEAGIPRAEDDTPGGAPAEQPLGDAALETRDPHSGSEHRAARYEPRDIRIRWLLAVAAGVCCFAVLQYYGVWRFLRFQEHAQAEIKTSSYPFAPAPTVALPPEPRLEQLDRLPGGLKPTLQGGMESPNVYDRLAAKEKALHSYGPSDEEGFVHIPIEQAMKAVASTLPVAKESSQGRAAKSSGLLDAGESNSGRMFRGPSP
jgi:hypothetical protein